MRALVAQMRALVARMQQVFGWWNLLLVLLLLNLIADIQTSIQVLGPQGIYVAIAEPQNAAMIAALIGATALLLIASWKYPRVEKTREFAEIIARIESSQEEYCLLLRPFGHDGRIALPFGYRPWWLPWVFGARKGLEATLAAAARKSARLRTYAVVDQSKSIAVGGLVPVRASPEMWQFAVSNLIRRAHSIIIVLPPGQTVRRGFAWELQEITKLGYQNRTCVVLPPGSTNSVGYTECVEQASLILATFERFAGSLDEVDSLTAFHYEKEILKYDTILIQTMPADQLGPLESIVYWPAGDEKRRAAVSPYRTALTETIAQTHRELCDLPFSQRYPRV